MEFVVENDLKLSYAVSRAEEASCCCLSLSNTLFLSLCVGHRSGVHPVCIPGVSTAAAPAAAVGAGTASSAQRAARVAATLWLKCCSLHILPIREKNKMC